MIDQINYEAARERIADYRRQADKARAVQEAKAHKQEEARRTNAETMRFAGPRERIAQIVGRWGRQATPLARG